MFLAAFSILAALALSLFNHWEITGETWGYWLFARVFAETGKFVIVDRSPLYALYLNIFRWLGYPASVTVEYLATTTILIAALIIFFKRYIGLSLSVFASILWMPFMQISEPPVQKLALACVFWAIIIRRQKEERFTFALSYALLAIAYMFRSLYLILIPLFLIRDSLKIFKKNRLRDLVRSTRPRLSDWPVLVVVGLLVYFLAMQSPHPSNNSLFASSTWFPCKGESNTAASFIAGYNAAYNSIKYKDSKDKDFYFTNQELFAGAATLPAAFEANPKFVTAQILRNIKAFIPLAINITEFHRLFLKITQLRILPKISPGWLCVFTLIAIILGAWRFCKDEYMKIFLISNTLLLVPTFIALPRVRYFFPLIPILIMSAFWYGKRLSGLFKSRAKILGYLSLPVFIILFSSGITDWFNLTKGLVKDLSQPNVNIMQERPYSMKASFNQIVPLIRDCKGVMVLEHAYIGAFTDIPLLKVYDIWEIPPFGELGNSVYNGLQPGRIDCLLISHDLSTQIGLSTNCRVRYENYIKPYAEQLQAKGAIIKEIKGYGKVVIMPKS